MLLRQIARHGLPGVLPLMEFRTKFEFEKGDIGRVVIDGLQRDEGGDGFVDFSRLPLGPSRVRGPPEIVRMKSEFLFKGGERPGGGEMRQCGNRAKPSGDRCRPVRSPWASAITPSQPGASRPASQSGCSRRRGDQQRTIAEFRTRRRKSTLRWARE